MNTEYPNTMLIPMPVTDLMDVQERIWQLQSILDEEKARLTAKVIDLTDEIIALKLKIVDQKVTPSPEEKRIKKLENQLANEKGERAKLTRKLYAAKKEADFQRSLHHHYRDTFKNVVRIMEATPANDRSFYMYRAVKDYMTPKVRLGRFMFRNQG